MKSLWILFVAVPLISCSTIEKGDLDVEERQVVLSERRPPLHCQFIDFINSKSGEGALQNCGFEKGNRLCMQRAAAEMGGNFVHILRKGHLAKDDKTPHMSEKELRQTTGEAFDFHFDGNVYKCPTK